MRLCLTLPLGWKGKGSPLSWVGFPGRLMIQSSGWRLAAQSANVVLPEAQEHWLEPSLAFWYLFSESELPPELVPTESLLPCTSSPRPLLTSATLVMLLCVFPE